MNVLFSEEFIRLNYPAVDKKSLLQDITSVFYNSGVISNQDEFFTEIWKRETIMSTGIGRQVAIPHSCHKSVNKFAIAFWQLADPLEFEAIDDKPVAIVFLIAIPPKYQNHYMKILSAISNFIRKQDNVNKLMNANNIKDSLKLLEQIKAN